VRKIEPIQLSRAQLKPMPSYPTLRRFMKANGLGKRRRVTSRQTDGADRAEDKLADREIRGYEAEYVGSAGGEAVNFFRSRRVSRATTSRGVKVAEQFKTSFKWYWARFAPERMIEQRHCYAYCASPAETH
jgi:hypothetical protein